MGKRFGGFRVSTLCGVYSFGVTEMYGLGDNYGGFKVLVAGSQAGPCFLLPYEHSKPAAKRVGCSIEGVHRRLEHTGYARAGGLGLSAWCMRNYSGILFMAKP